MLPLPGQDPAGIDLKYSDLYTRIEEERREDDPELQSKLQEDGRSKAKKANFAQVVTLAGEALASKSKDLWLSVWLCDALIHEQNLTGLRQGLELTYKLLGQYWDSIYPKLDAGDPWPRLAPLNWLGDYCNAAKGSSPILAIRMLSFNGDQSDPAKFKSEERKRYYRALIEDAKASQATLTALDEFCQGHFTEEPPSFSVLVREIEKAAITVHSLLESERKTSPDPVALPDKPGPSKLPAAQSSLDPLSSSHFHPPLASELKTSAEAVHHITAASRFLQKMSPSDPVPYLLIRALRWGELRGADEARFESLLESPPVDLRIAVKRYATAGNWELLLDTAEATMCTGCGRGWLDLQRYAITACENLGYHTVVQALRSELKQLLSDFPQLATATLLDDTGAANPETTSWLRKEGFTN